MAESEPNPSFPHLKFFLLHITPPYLGFPSPPESTGNILIQTTEPHSLGSTQPNYLLSWRGERRKRKGGEGRGKEGEKGKKEEKDIQQPFLYRISIHINQN